MFELAGIVKVRRPEGTRWNDGAAFWFGVHLVERDTHERLYEEAPVEDVQSYARFQCFVAREFGLWFRYPPAEDPESGQRAWSEYLASVWGHNPVSDEQDPPAYFDAAPWAADES
jgi:hypothetical protein